MLHVEGLEAIMLDFSKKKNERGGGVLNKFHKKIPKKWFPGNFFFFGGVGAAIFIEVEAG